MKVKVRLSQATDLFKLCSLVESSTYLNSCGVTLIIDYCVDASWARRGIFQECVTSDKRFSWSKWIRFCKGRHYKKKKNLKETCFLDNLGQVLRGHLLTLVCMVGNFCLFFFSSSKVEGNENFINTIYINTILLVIHTCWSALDKSNFRLLRMRSTSALSFWREIKQGDNSVTGRRNQTWTCIMVYELFHLSSCMYNPSSFTSGDFIFTSLVIFYSLFR